MPLLLICIPAGYGKNEYYTIESTFIKLMSQDLLKEALTSEVVNKRVLPSIELDPAAFMQKLSLFYRKMATLKLNEAAAAATQAKITKKCDQSTQNEIVTIRMRVQTKRALLEQRRKAYSECNERKSQVERQFKSERP